jgi:hypothetical protein
MTEKQKAAIARARQIPARVIEIEKLSRFTAARHHERTHKAKCWDYGYVTPDGQLKLGRHVECPALLAEQQRLIRTWNE